MESDMKNVYNIIVKTHQSYIYLSSLYITSVLLIFWYGLNLLFLYLYQFSVHRCRRSNVYLLNFKNI